MSHSSTTTAGRIAPVAITATGLTPLLVTALLFLLVGLFMVWSRLHVLHLEYEISGLEGRIRAAQQQTSQLRLEAATLRRPEAVEKVAQSEFGLVMPDPRQMIVVR